MKRAMQDRLEYSGEVDQKVCLAYSGKEGALVGRHEALHRPTCRHHRTLGKC